MTNSQSPSSITSTYIALVCALVVIWWLAACIGCASAGFEGDGRLIDHGPMAAIDRYVVDLGTIDLATQGTRTFVVGNLPPQEFVVGLELAALEPMRIGSVQPILQGNVRLIVETADNQLVIAEDAPLKDWIKTYHQGDTRYFLYRVGRDVEVPLGNGITKVERVGTRIDGGWGTYFLPQRNGRYKLTLSVLEGQSTLQHPARLILKGGGWK